MTVDSAQGKPWFVYIGTSTDPPENCWKERDPRMLGKRCRPLLGLSKRCSLMEYLRCTACKQTAIHNPYRQAVTSVVPIITFVPSSSPDCFSARANPMRSRTSRNRARAPGL